MRLFVTSTACLVVVVGAWAAHVHAEAVAPPLYALCWNDLSAVLDVSVESADDVQVSGVVNEAFVRDDPASDGGPAASFSAGDEVTLPGWCGSATTAGARALLLLDAEGSCTRAFALDDAGVLEEGRPDVITSEEAGDAAMSEDCQATLNAAGYNPVYEESPLVRLLGCSATSAADGPLLFATFALLAAYRGRSRRRRGRDENG